MRIGRRAVAALVVAVGGFVAMTRPSAAPVLNTTAAELHPEFIAVLPFRLPDTVPPGFEDLRDWLQDLLVARFTGEGSPWALDPRTVAAALPHFDAQTVLSPDAQNALQTRLGAGLLLRGGLGGTPDHLTIAATLGGGLVTVSGNADSLPYLADQVTLRLLAKRAAASPMELADFSKTSLAALRAYLAGREAYRRDRTHEAKEYFDRALLLDSLFAPAALGVATLQTSFWFWSGGDQRWLADAVWRRRGAMRPGDRALLVAYLGPHYPGPSRTQEMIAAAEQATRLAPRQIEAWYILSKYLRWYGRDLGWLDWQTRSITALHHAFALDSTHAEVLNDLVVMAVAVRDTTDLRRYIRIYLAHDSTERAASLHWLAAWALGDTAALKGVRSQFGRLGVTDLMRINYWAQTTPGAAIEDADSVTRFLLPPFGTAGTPSNLGSAMYLEAVLLLNQGRPTEASRVIDQVTDRSFAWPGGPRRLLLYADMFWDGNHGSAVAAARRMQAYVDRTSRTGADIAGRQTASCALAEWRAASGHREGARATLARIGQSPPGDYFGVSGTEDCVAVVEALLASGAEARAALVRLDSHLLNPWASGDGWELALGDLVAARLHEARGDLRGALAAIRRLNGIEFLSTQLRQEGRLSALVGDTAAAIRAYRHYLDLRKDPEPQLRSAVDSVRAELLRIEG